MAKRKEEPIPEDLMAMTLEQLDEEVYSHDRGTLRFVREQLVIQRDEAQDRLDKMSRRRYDISRAIIAKMEKELGKS